MHNSKRGSGLFPALAALLLFSTLGHTATFVTVRQQSAANDIGTKFSTDVDGGSVQILLQSGNRFEVFVTGGNSQALHSFTFTGPEGSLIAPGRYDDTSPTGFAPGSPIFNYTGTTGCSAGPPGYFVVREFDYPTRIAIDYFHRCGSFVDIRRPMHTMGSIRINSTIPAMDFPPWADGGLDIYAEEGEEIGLGSERSYPGEAPITSYRYRQLSGPAVTVPATGSVNFTAPSVPTTGADLSFELEVTNALGLMSTDVVNVHLDSLQGRRTFIQLQGDSDNYLYPTEARLARYSMGSFGSLDAGGSPDRLRIEYRFIGPGGTLWSFMFAAPNGQRFVLDNYENAEGAGSPTVPMIQVSGGGRGCNVESGRFVVLEFDYDAVQQTVRSLAIDFEHHCENAPSKLLGWIRINSAVPVLRAAPDAAAGGDQNVEIGENVTLDAGESIPGQGPVTIWRWRQISGTPAALTGANTARASFVAPSVAAQGDSLTFEVDITNSQGLNDTDQVTVFVRGALGLRNFVRIAGDAGEPITGGGTFEYNALQANLIEPEAPHDRRTIDLILESAERWRMTFTAPSGRELEVGRYDTATSAHSSTPTRVGVSVTGRGVGCSTVDGSLRIFEVSFDPVTNALTRLAADFDQRCETFTGLLRGSIRFQSALSVPFTGVLVAAGVDQRAEERQSVRLDASRSVAALNSTLTYRWAQVSGSSVTLSNASSAVSTFTAPEITGSPLPLEFEVQVSDGAGHTGTDRIRVDVVDRARPQTVVTLTSDSGDWIGGGESFTLRPEEWNFSTEGVELGDRIVLHFEGLARWDLWFGTGTSAPFQVRAYESATGTPTGTTPIVNVSGRGNGCGSNTGRFDVRDVALTSSGAIDRLVLQFTQRCDGSAAELRGTLVYRSPMPDANAGADNAVDEGGNVTLSAASSSAAVGTLTSYMWTQTSGPAVTLTGAATASATFVTPDVLTATALAFELEVTDSRGLKSVDAIQVTVRPVTAPSPPTPGGGGGGGGAMSPLSLAWLMLILVLRRASLPGTRRCPSS